MKKLLAIGALIAALAATPWFVGNSVQNSLDEQIAMIAAAPGYTAKIVDYRRGLLSASGKIQIGIDVADVSFETVEEQQIFEALQEGIELDMQISHGPFLFKPTIPIGISHSVVTLAKDQSLAAKAKELFGVEQPLMVELMFKFGGNGKMILSVPELNFTEAENQFSFGGLNAQYDLSDYGQRYTFVGSIAAVKIVDDGKTIETSPTAMSGEGEIETVKPIDQSIAHNYLWGIGSAEMTMPSLAINTDQDINAKNISLKVALTRPQKSNLDIEYKISVDEVSGTALPERLENAVVDITVENLKESALRQIFEISNRYDLADPSALSEHQKKLQQLGAEMLMASPALKINQISFEFGKDMHMNLVGKLGINAASITDASMVNNPLMLIPAIDSSLVANISEGLLNMVMQQYVNKQLAEAGLSEEDMQSMSASQNEQSSLMIKQYEQMGFLKKTENGYQIDASFKDSQFKVNGNVMPLPL